MSNKKYQSPAFYIKLRFLKNKAAMVGMLFIVIAQLVAVFAYLIMPDSTPHGNDGSASIKKMPAGFHVIMLKELKRFEVKNVNFFERLVYGQESRYTILPLQEVAINGWHVCYKLYGKQNEVCTPVMEYVSTLLPDASNGNWNTAKYQIKGNYLYYRDDSSQTRILSLASIKNIFRSHCLEDRKFILGTDKAGRDVLSRLILGTRISLAIGFIAVVVSFIIGIIIGSVGGYFGGFTDKAALWLMTVVWSIPGIMLVIAISLAAQSKGVWVVFVAVGLTMWVEVARVVRGQIMVLKQRLYIEAATALGIGDFRIMFKHMLPNMMGPLIVTATANFATAILVEAGLSFLGLGVQPPMPSWGMMVSEGYNTNWEGHGWQLVLLPSLCICMLVLAFNLFGNGLRDAYDPQTSVKW